MSKQNYTEEMVTFATETYKELKEQGLTNEAVLEHILADERFKDKNERSLRSKLVREEVYVAEPKKNKSSKQEGPSKKELVNQLVKLTGRDLTGIEGAAKGALTELIELFDEEKVSNEVRQEEAA